MIAQLRQRRRPLTPPSPRARGEGGASVIAEEGKDALTTR
jgi:hypothetical protein